MTFGDLTTSHLGRDLHVYGGTRITIGAIKHETYHDKPRTILWDHAHIRRWIYTSDRECILL